MTTIPKLFMRVVGKVVTGHLEVWRLFRFCQNWLVVVSTLPKKLHHLPDKIGPRIYRSLFIYLSVQKYFERLSVPSLNSDWITQNTNNLS